MQVKTEC